MLKNDINNSQKDRKFVNILGIDVLSTDMGNLLASIKENLAYNSRFSIFTPNPELVLASTDNQKLKEALKSSDFLIPDGVGLRCAAKFLHGESLNIIPGRVLFSELIKLAGKKGYKIFLLGGKGNEAALTAKKISEKYKDIKIQSSKGARLTSKGRAATVTDISLLKDAVDRINKFNPDLLFVAFGNPKQEIWIHNNLPKLKIKCAMAVGGTFRYVAGIAPVPPKWMEGWGEWLWRLITEPKRIKRIWNAVILFPLAVIKSKFGA